MTRLLFLLRFCAEALAFAVIVSVIGMVFLVVN